MSKQLLALFKSNGLPQTGLSAVVTVIETVTDTEVVSDAAMTEVGRGFYKYDFTAYDPTITYAILYDGGATLPAADRYQAGGNEQATADFVQLIESGRWEITDDDGGTMIFYAADSTTPILTFKLFNKAGVRSSNPAAIVERDPRP